MRPRRQGWEVLPHFTPLEQADAMPVPSGRPGAAPLLDLSVLKECYLRICLLVNVAKFDPSRSGDRAPGSEGPRWGPLNSLSLTVTLWLSSLLVSQGNRFTNIKTLFMVCFLYLTDICIRACECAHTFLSQPLISRKEMGQTLWCLAKCQALIDIWWLGVNVPWGCRLKVKIKTNPKTNQPIKQTNKKNPQEV